MTIGTRILVSWEDNGTEDKGTICPAFPFAFPVALSHPIVSSA
jgi:hypothetical protein